MKNRALAVFSKPIPYYKSLRPLAGSITAAILMQQLDYWFDLKPDGFYKFQSPAQGNNAYKEGDSWQEELAISPKEFRTAFDKIGKRYPSKNTYTETLKKGKDIFEGKFYCSFYDKVRGLTFYYRNHDLVDLKLNEIAGFRPPSRSEFLGDTPPPSRSEFPEVTDRSFPTFPIGVSRSDRSEFPLNTESTNRDYKTEITLTTDARARNKKTEREESRKKAWLDLYNQMRPSSWSTKDFLDLREVEMVENYALAIQSGLGLNRDKAEAYGLENLKLALQYLNSEDGAFFTKPQTNGSRHNQRSFGFLFARAKNTSSLWIAEWSDIQKNKNQRNKTKSSENFSEKEKSQSLADNWDPVAEIVAELNGGASV